jgi:chromate transporter
MNQLPALARVFGYLSLLTVGGGMAAFPALTNLTVNVHHWLTMRQLIHFYSVGQMAPGPNMMMIVSVGEKVAGLLGALVVVVAFFLPTALLCFVVGRLWIRLVNWPWRRSIELGLAPVSIGLFLAGCLILGKGAVTGWVDLIVCAVVFTVILRTKINPAFLILGGAVVGVVAFGLIG